MQIFGETAKRSIEDRTQLPYFHLFRTILKNKEYTPKLIEFIEKFNISPKAYFHGAPLIMHALDLVNTDVDKQFTTNIILADYLINKGININNIEYTGYIGPDGLDYVNSNTTLLMAAALLYNKDAVLYLLEKGASRTIRAKNGEFDGLTAADILEYKINDLNTRLKTININIQKLESIDMSIQTRNEIRNILREIYDEDYDELPVDISDDESLTQFIEYEIENNNYRKSSIENKINKYTAIKNLVKAPYRNNNLKTAKNRLKPSMRNITGSLSFRGVKDKTLPQNVVKSIVSYTTSAYNKKKTRKARKNRKSRKSRR